MKTQHMYAIDIFPWSDNFNTGLAEVDLQHRKLAELLNRLASQVAYEAHTQALGEIFDELADYAVYHFTTEEAIWHTYFASSSEERTHIATHALFCKEVSRLKTALQSAGSSFQVAEKALDFLARWLASHILETDRHMAYVVHAIQRGLPLDAAKVQAREEMAGTTRVLIDIILTTYSTLSSNTLHLMRELAEHKQADEALKQSEARWKFALESSSDGLWDWNIADNSFSLNHRWKEMLGFDDVEIGTGIDEWENRIHPADKAETLAKLQTYFDGKVPNYLTEYRVLCKDGSYKWILNRGKVVSRSEDGKPLRMIGTHTDITHQKEAEIKLRSSETLLRATLESTDEGILMIGSQGQVLSANKRFIELWCVPEELSAKGQDDLLIAHVLDQLIDPDVFLDLVKRLYGTDEESRDILNFKNGRVFARFTRALFIGNQLGRIWCFRDITEQSHAQAALTESNTLLQTIIESTPIRIFWKDKSLRYLGCNTAFARDAGMPSPQDIIGKDDYQMGWREQAELYRADDRLVMDYFKPKLSFDEQQTTPAGETIWLRTSKVPLCNVDNQNIGLLGIYEDITEHKKYEEELRASEHKLNSILDNVDAYIYLKDTEGRYLFANKPLRELWHAEIQDIIGCNDEKFLDGQTAANIRSNDSRVLKAGETIRTEEINTVPAIGKTKIYLSTKLPLRHDDGSIYALCGISTDITERKKLEDIQTFLAKTTSSHLGESFFEELARYLSQSLGMFYVCIDRLEGDGLKATTLAIWCDDKFEDNVTYSLKDTPCGDVVGNKVCCFPASVCQYFPRDQVLQDLCAESYIGVTLFSHSGQPIGLIAVIGREPLAIRPLAESILKLVAIRAAGELERLFDEEKLKLSANVFANAREGIFITEVDGTIIDVNEAFTRITGYSRDEVIGKSPRILSSGRQSKEFYVDLWFDLINKGHWSGEVWNSRKNGEVYPVMITISAVRNTEGETQHYVALFSDISVLKEHEQKLEHIAHYDTLTNLPNRVLLADRLHQSMTQAQRRNQRLAVVYLDLDGFKAINDNHGHDVGDQLLIAVATRMKQALREGDTLARIGGDEFVAVLLDLADIDSSVPMLERLLAAAAEPVEFGGQVLHISASLGVTCYPQMEEVDADQLMRQADQAMYQAKLAGRNRYSVFDAEHDISLRGHHEAMEDIRRALIAREFVLYYQPKVDIRSGAVIGAEALIRWQHPEKGLLPPGEFLPMLEEHPLAVQIGEWVIDSALTQIELWHQADLDIPVSVNVGALQLQQAGFVENLRVVLAAHPDVKPSFLEIEVLETSAVKDIAHVSQVMDECREIGVNFALDDFGTGYSSLTYLHNLPISKIKIDQSFVRDMTSDHADQVMVKTIIDMGRNFNLKVIAEGVETENQLMLLKQLGCVEYQGYLFSKPVQVEQFEALLNKV